MKLHRFFIILLIFIFTLGFTACSKNSSKNNNSVEQEEESTSGDAEDIPEEEENSVSEEEDISSTDLDESVDTDGDGAENNANTDDDGDGTIDVDDVFSTDSTESVDTDNDGIGNNSDIDLDGDATLSDEDVDSDNDGDGVQAAIDCNDNNVIIYPGATETCNSTDDDCDGTIDEDDASDAATWYADSDGDSYGDPKTTTKACSQPDGFITDATDCDDADDTINTAATEICDSKDNDCDGLTNESGGEIRSFYVDADGDGYGDSLATVTTVTDCSSTPSGYVENNTDCDDTNEAIHPDAVEVCDNSGVDENCDGSATSGTLYSGDLKIGPGDESSIVGWLAGKCGVDGDLVIQGTSLANLDDFKELTTINGSIEVNLNISLTDTQGFASIVYVSDTISIGLNDSLEFLSGFDSLKTASGIVLLANKSLKTLPDFGSLEKITEHLYVGENEALTGLRGMSQLTSVGGDLTFEKNSALSNCDILEFVKNITVGETTTLSDNLADADCDGVSDADDAFDDNVKESEDTDGDGLGNNIDKDDDGDGVPDTLDVFPEDATETKDSDGDGVGDNSDALPLDANESVDADSDKVGANADCDDTNALIFPGAREICNSVDDDCDGTVDEDCSSDTDNGIIDNAVSESLATTTTMGVDLFASVDKDGDGSSASEDCDDKDATIYPGADGEDGNDIDEDCNGADDEYAIDSATAIFRGYRLDFDGNNAFEIDNIGAGLWYASNYGEAGAPSYSREGEPIALDSDSDDVYDGVTFESNAMLTKSSDDDVDFDWEAHHSGILYDSSTMQVYHGYIYVRCENGSTTSSIEDVTPPECQEAESVSVNVNFGSDWYKNPDDYYYYVAVDGFYILNGEPIGGEDIQITAYIYNPEKYTNNNDKDSDDDQSSNGNDHYMGKDGNLRVIGKIDYNGPEATPEYKGYVFYTIIGLKKDLWATKWFGWDDGTVSEYTSTISLTGLTDLSDESQAFVIPHTLGFDGDESGVFELDNFEVYVALESVSSEEATVKISGRIYGYESYFASSDKGKYIKADETQGYLIYCKDSRVCNAKQKKVNGSEGSKSNNSGDFVDNTDGTINF